MVYLKSFETNPQTTGKHKGLDKWINLQYILFFVLMMGTLFFFFFSFFFFFFFSKQMDLK